MTEGLGELVKVGGVLGVVLLCFGVVLCCVVFGLLWFSLVLSFVLFFLVMYVYPS